MSDTPDWKGRRLGPYLVGERFRFPNIPEDEGRLHAAHHVETGEPALVLVPGVGDEWRTSTHLMREPRPIRSRNRATRWGLAGTGSSRGGRTCSPALAE